MNFLEKSEVFPKIITLQKCKVYIHLDSFIKKTFLRNQIDKSNIKFAILLKDE